MLMLSSKEKLIKGLSAAFVVLCLYQAISGFYFYCGRLAFNDGNYSNAIKNFKISLAMEKREEALLLMGRAILKTEGALKSRPYFKQAVGMQPRNAKALIYLASTYGVSPEIASLESWRIVRSYLIKALQYEPGNAWVHYEVGRMFLAHSQFLTPEDEQKALEHLKKSLEIRLIKNYSRFLEQPSDFIRSVLNLVWRNGHDFRGILAVVPVEFSSYRALLEWMDQKGLWHERKEIHAVYLRLRDSYYATQCGLGEKFLSENKFTEALEAFRKAYWSSDWSFTRAKAGILIAEEKLGVLPDGRNSLFQNDWKDALISALRDDSLSDNLLTGLAGLVRKAESPAISGLYAARTGDCASAVNYLEKDGPVEASARRFLAVCYKGSQKDQEASIVLSKALLEKLPDLRDLLLLNEWLPAADRGQINEKISKAETLRIPSKAWWGDQGFSFLLGTESKKNLTLNLRPGKASVRIIFKLLNPSKVSYLVFRVNQKDIGGAVASATHWQIAELEFETPGGIQWLTAEILNRPSDAQSNLAAVELGAVSVRYAGK